MKKIIPGLLLTLGIAYISRFLSNLFPVHVIGAGVIALFMGMILNPWVSQREGLYPGITFTGKKVLRFAIILMGISLSFHQVLKVGSFSLIVMVFTLFAAFFGGYLLGKLLGLDWKLSGLISSGTGICGGSAIAAVAPVIGAKDQFIAYAISATFIFDVFMVVLFPLMGEAMNLSDLGFGLWTGTAINDTSSVVAAGYSYSEAAGDFAVIVKLTRTLAIIPVVLIFSMIAKKHSTGKTSPHILEIFPWFILGFLAMVGLNSTGWIPASLSGSLSTLGRFFMIMALGAIGLRTNFKELSRSGIKPLIHGISISTLVVVVSLVVQYFLGSL
ncbi:putative sulfate exporter family transporter [Isachenkonia alkalipeptolytica]|uniref:Sulfate exporter family transporter n=1 Tax=Isachenkonia alkalipeptolytica TaxID=2565777 RepID=A0AA43XMJ2_9CLOT|nr:putative sulfate exporter family transporter [Isachenkonia alkalipeptolytica]